MLTWDNAASTLRFGWGLSGGLRLPWRLPARPISVPPRPRLHCFPALCDVVLGWVSEEKGAQGEGLASVWVLPFDGVHVFPVSEHSAADGCYCASVNSNKRAPMAWLWFII